MKTVAVSLNEERGKCRKKNVNLKCLHETIMTLEVSLAFGCMMHWCELWMAARMIRMMKLATGKYFMHDSKQLLYTTGTLIHEQMTLCLRLYGIICYLATVLVIGLCSARYSCPLWMVSVNYLTWERHKFSKYY